MAPHENEVHLTRKPSLSETFPLRSVMNKFEKLFQAQHQRLAYIQNPNRSTDGL